MDVLPGDDGRMCGMNNIGDGDRRMVATRPHVAAGGNMGCSGPAAML